MHICSSTSVSKFGKRLDHGSLEQSKRVNRHGGLDDNEITFFNDMDLTRDPGQQYDFKQEIFEIRNDLWSGYLSFTAVNATPTFICSQSEQRSHAAAIKRDVL